jgi:hypothetical protein
VETYDGPGHETDYAEALTADASGNVYVTGESTGSGTYYDYATIKYNPAGNQQWVSRYDGPENDDDEAYDIAVDIYGNVYVTGYITMPNGYSDFGTIMYDSSGTEQWVMTYNGPGDEYDDAVAIAADDQGNVWVTGNSFGNGTDGDFATIKYSQTLNIGSPWEAAGPRDFRIAPNPSRGSFYVEYYLPEASSTDIRIFDISGRLVMESFQPMQTEGYHQQEMDGLTTGLYICRLRTTGSPLSISFVVTD